MRTQRLHQSVEWKEERFCALRRSGNHLKRTLKRNDKRRTEGREEQPPGGQRRRILDLQNGCQKPVREFTSMENWSLVLTVMLVLSVRTSGGLKCWDNSTVVCREKGVLCSTRFDLIYRTHINVLFLPPSPISALNVYFFLKVDFPPDCLSQRKWNTNLLQLIFF